MSERDSQGFTRMDLSDYELTPTQFVEKIMSEYPETLEGPAARGRVLNVARLREAADYYLRIGRDLCDRAVVNFLVFEPSYDSVTIELKCNVLRVCDTESFSKAIMSSDETTADINLEGGVCLQMSFYGLTQKK